MGPEANLVSFVLRFVSDQTTDPSEAAVSASSWHGLIRHVQTNEERTFTRWTDAVAFISRYVDIDQVIADD